MKIEIRDKLTSMHVNEDGEDIEGNAKYWSNATKMCESYGVKYELIGPDDLGLVYFNIYKQTVVLEDQSQLNDFRFDVLDLFDYYIFPVDGGFYILTYDDEL